MPHSAYKNAEFRFAHLWLTRQVGIWYGSEFSMWYLKMMGEYYFFIFMSFMKKFVKSIYILENITINSYFDNCSSKFLFSKKDHFNLEMCASPKILRFGTFGKTFEVWGKLKLVASREVSEPKCMNFQDDHPVNG